MGDYDTWFAMIERGERERGAVATVVVLVENTILGHFVNFDGMMYACSIDSHFSLPPPSSRSFPRFSLDWQEVFSPFPLQFLLEVVRRTRRPPSRNKSTTDAMLHMCPHP